MRVGMIDTQAIRQRWTSVGSKLDERGRRVFAAGEVRAAGWGGLEAVSEITGLARSTIGRGQKDLDAASLPKGRVRRKGGGRRHLSSRDATLIEDLRSVIEPATLGDPMRPLLWVSKSHDKVAVALQKKGHEISASSVKRLLPTLGYSRQSNRKSNEGSKHPDRNAYGRGRADCCNHDQSWPESRERARYRDLRKGHQSQQCRDEDPRHPGRHIPS